MLICLNTNKNKRKLIVTIKMFNFLFTLNQKKFENDKTSSNLWLLKNSDAISCSTFGLKQRSSSSFGRFFVCGCLNSQKIWSLFLLFGDSIYSSVAGCDVIALIVRNWPWDGILLSLVDISRWLVWDWEQTFSCNWSLLLTLKLVVWLLFAVAIEALAGA